MRICKDLNNEVHTTIRYWVYEPGILNPGSSQENHDKNDQLKWNNIGRSAIVK